MSTPPKGRPTYCTIDLAALRWNFNQVKKLVGPRVKVLSVVKANAYGHGAVACARALTDAGSDAFGVATVEEAIELRAAGIRAPLLVLTAICPEQLDEFLKYDLIPGPQENQKHEKPDDGGETEATATLGGRRSRSGRRCGSKACSRSSRTPRAPTGRIRRRRSRIFAPSRSASAPPAPRRPRFISRTAAGGPA